MNIDKLIEELRKMTKALPETAILARQGQLPPDSHNVLQALARECRRTADAVDSVIDETGWRFL